MDQIGPLQSRQCPDRFARLFLGEADFVEALQIQPKLRAGAEEMCEAKGGVACDGAGSV